MSEGGERERAKEGFFTHLHFGLGSSRPSERRGGKGKGERGSASFPSLGGREMKSARLSLSLSLSLSLTLSPSPLLSLAAC